jgi:hypothetical protein
VEGYVDQYNESQTISNILEVSAEGQLTTYKGATGPTGNTGHTGLTGPPGTFTNTVIMENSLFKGETIVSGGVFQFDTSGVDITDAYIDNTALQLINNSSNQHTLTYSGPWNVDASSIYYSGDVGISTTSPDYTLDISGYVAANSIVLNYDSGAYASYATINDVSINQYVLKKRGDEFIITTSESTDDVNVNEIIANLILEIKSLKERVTALEP